MTPASLSLGLASAGFVGFAALAWKSVSPTSTLWGPLHSRGPTDAPHYALTFDDGPTPDSTSAILDTLGELNARAAFFVIGVNARRCPDLLARMHAEGHIVANHTLDHHYLSMFRGPAYWNRQLAEADQIIEETIGLRPAMYRPPMGVKTFYVMGAAARRSQAVITWTRRAVDGIPTTSDKILNRLCPSTAPGDILLLHDGIEPNRPRRDPSATVAAIKPLIQRLRDRGLEPARLDSFLHLPAYQPSASPAALPEPQRM
jgi:peptidoglycan/xylan/chitin deacetylase (PgdA/CDA1 family)